MKTLLHICCAPCSIVPAQALRDRGMDVMGFYYRHNIHPFTECMRRQQTLEDYSNRIGLRVIYQDGYDMEGFVRNVAFREDNRCSYCYHDRLRTTALMAKRGKFDYSHPLCYTASSRNMI